MKKPQQYSLHIDESCHEPWDAMLQVNKGKYCLHCAKTVIEFTNLSDVEIDTIVKQQHANGKTTFCGRFRSEQLDRPLVIPQPQRNSYFALPVLIAGALAVSTTEEASAQEVPVSMQCASQDTTKAPAKPSNVNITTDTLRKSTPQNIIANSTTIIGYVRDESSNPLGGVTIKVLGTTRGAISKSDARFIIYNVPKGVNTIKVNYVGLEQQLLPYNTLKPDLLNIILKPSNVKMGMLGMVNIQFLDPKEVGKIKHLKIDE